MVQTHVSLILGSLSGSKWPDGLPKGLSKLVVKQTRGGAISEPGLAQAHRQVQQGLLCPTQLSLAKEKTLESPLDSKEIKPVNPTGLFDYPNPGYSLEGLMLKLKLQYFGHLM